MVPASSPLVSVVVPYFNAAPWVAAAVSSVLEQTWPTLELLVVNDGSPDRDALSQALAGLGAHPRAGVVRVIDQENRGPSAARNTGLRHARGSFIAFLDADDTWAATLLERALVELTADGGPDLVFFDGWLLGPEGRPTERLSRRSPSVRAPGLVEVAGGTSTVFTTGTVVRRASVEAVGGFDERLRRSEDFDLWLRLLLTGSRIAAIPEPLIYRRVLPTGLASEPNEMRRAALGVLEHHLERGALTGAAARAARRFRRQLRGDYHTRRARHALGAGRSGEARREMLHAVRAWPTPQRALALLSLALLPGVVARWFRTTAQAPADP